METLNYPEDFAVGGELVKSVSVSGPLTNLNFSSSKLIDELQDAVNTGRELFQLKLGLNHATDNDGLTDYYKFELSGSRLYVEYEMN